jgi:hypothetical protein
MRGVLTDGKKTAGIGRACNKRQPAPKAPVILVGALRPRETSQVFDRHVRSIRSDAGELLAVENVYLLAVCIDHPCVLQLREHPADGLEFEPEIAANLFARHP